MSRSWCCPGLVLVSSEDCLNTLLGVKQREHWSVPGLFNIQKSCFYSSCYQPKPQVVLEGEGKGESGQPFFPSFSRSLLQGLPTSDISATSPPCAFGLITDPSPLTLMQSVTGSLRV
ncbi:hypothetical protein ACRRTK_011381 [Alexandromys fortis]